MCCIDMFHKTSLYTSPQIFFIAAQNFPQFFISYLFFPPKLFSLIFFFFLFIRLPLLKLLKVENPFFISHPTPFFFSFFFFSLTHFHFHHAELSLTIVELSLSHLHRPQPPPQPQPPPPPQSTWAPKTSTSRWSVMSSRGAARVGFSVSFSLFLFWVFVIVLDWF